MQHDMIGVFLIGNTQFFCDLDLLALLAKSLQAYT